MLLHLIAKSHRQPVAYLSRWYFELFLSFLNGVAQGLIISRMSVLHLIEARTPLDILEQLALLRTDGEQVVCIGPMPPYLPPRLEARQHLPPLRTLAMGACCLEPASPVKIVHAWSLGVMHAAQDISRRHGSGLALSLTEPPSTRQLNDIKNVFESAPGKFACTFPGKATCGEAIKAGLAPEAAALLPPAALPADADSPGLRRSARAALGVADEDILLVCADDMTEGGGQKLAIWAHAIVRQVLPNVRLLLPGDGRTFRSVQFFADTTGYLSEIYFTGYDMSRSQSLAAADVAMTTGERTTSPAALAAAMAAGLAVVATALPQTLEYLPADAALLVATKDPRRSAAATLKLCDEPQLRLELGSRARQAAMALDPQKVRQQLDAVYGQIISGKREPEGGRNLTQLCNVFRSSLGRS